MADEYIDREAVFYQLVKQATIDGQPRAIKRAAKIVADFPAADVVDVVRCKECRHGYDSVGGRHCAYGVCVDCVVDDDFYCADGERKEQDE